ncbi:helix-turn-helix domain-containing protein [Actinomadura rubrobrunea]|uniref:helix-turn-helix domain-containing protein n=2 Tax=Actinomadura rubrobrunea TaxID=115335 RepID=UPI000D05094D|nr:helix-turn-helix transcriptional regulator [Actinomadura rubrobrunea]
MARDNSGGRCAPCQARARDRFHAPPEVPPDFWQAEPLRKALEDWHIGHAIRAYRHHPFHGHKPLSQELVGHWLGMTQTQLSRIESGPPVTDLDRLIPWARTLRIPPDLLWFKLPENRDQKIIGVKRPPQERDAAGTVDHGPTPDFGENDVRRRVALQLFTYLGLGAGALGAESMRRLVDLFLTTEPRDLNDWHLACNDHLYALRTRPPLQVREDLLIDLVALKRQLQVAGAKELTELKRVEAALATLHANVLTRLGDHGAAIRWWRTAKESAAATGDLELQLAIRSTEAGNGRYGQRSPEAALGLTRDAMRLAGQQPTLGKALVTCSHAKALGLVGRHSDAQRTLAMCEDLFAAAGSPPDVMPGYWTGGQLEYTRLLVHAGAGNEPEVDAAIDQYMTRVLSRISDHQFGPQAHLQRALCTIVNGGIDRGAKEAIAVLDAVPVTSRTNMITAVGSQVLRAVPLDQRERPAVRELHDVLIKTAPSCPPLSSA